MKRIRVGNDFFWVWEIKDRGAPVDLLEVKDTVRISYEYKDGIKVLDEKYYTILENGLIRIETKTELFDKIGRYKFILNYIHVDTSMSDDDRKREADYTPFVIVSLSALADEYDDIPVTSDVAIGLKGEKGDKMKFSDLTEAEKLELVGGMTSIPYSETIYNDIII